MKRWGAIVALVVVVLIAHGAVLTQWWLWDDPQVLYGVMRYSLADSLTKPEVWRAQSGTNFVPLLLTSYELDYALFGLEPRGYYAHHLAMFVTAMVLLFLYVRTFASQWVALLAAVTAALSAPAWTAASLLMDRHYVEGVPLAIGALLLFRASRDKPWLAVLGAGAYLLAALEKEVFAPLPLLVLAQDLVAWGRGRPMGPIGPMGEPVPPSAAPRGPRGPIGPMSPVVLLRNLAACSVAAVLYLAWRLVMLGAAGGYGRGRNTTELLSLPVEVWHRVIGPLALVAALLALALLILKVRSVQAVAVIVLATIFSLLPITFLRDLDHRYVFVPMCVLVVLAATAAVNRIGTIVFAGFCVTMVIGGFLHRATLVPSLRLMQSHGLYLWNAPPNARPILTGPNGWYTEGIRWMRKAAKGDDAPHAIASLPGVYLSGADVAVMGDANEVRAAVAAIGRDRDPSMPLHVSFEHDSTIARWKFAPHEPGVRWYFMTLPSYELIELEAEGWTRYPTHFRAPSYEAMPEAGVFRIVRMKNGRWNVSPELKW
ncbi:MAG TPA: hypothetical protein VGF69_21280 [Thermoanaerobaculia bacterium]|jgi:hypothetical protein